MTADVRRNLEEIQARIARACAASGRSRESVRLIAVSKTLPGERVDAAIEAGVTDIGENRVQEFREKLPKIQRVATWHMIGHLQSNKAREAVALFDVIHSVDRVSLSERLAAEAARLNKTVDVLIQVNIGSEPQKSGVSPSELESLAGHIAQQGSLRLIGLMTIPPVASEPETRDYFRRMRQLRDRLSGSPGLSQCVHLSMGMSDDFELAIKEGATMIRVGRAIFGERD